VALRRPILLATVGIILAGIAGVAAVWLRQPS
jgi:hypothetical protein